MTWKPPRKSAWQVKPGARGSWLVRCPLGNEKVSPAPDAEWFALHLWHIGHAAHGHLLPVNTAIRKAS